jgi:LTXXQ motif family protein
MVAMTAPHSLLPIAEAAPADSGGGQQTMRQPSAAQIAARHKQMCQDEYAHQVGELAYLEAKLNLTAPQQPLFDRWKNVKLDIAKRAEADCTTRELPARDANARPSPLDGMAREEDILKRRLTDLDAERPALSALYNTLNVAQKDGFMHPDGMIGANPMMGRRMFPAMGSNRDRMRSAAPPNGPMGAPADHPPPSAPQ